MFGISDYGAFVAAIVLFLAIPGPGNLALITSTSKGGVRGGLAATMGVIAGDQVLMWAAVAGVAALLSAYPAAFNAVQWLGAAYLLYLGVQMWRAKGGPDRSSQAAGSQPWRILGRAFMVNILHPKGLAFYAAFMPQFIVPTQPVLLQMVVLGAVFSGIALLVLLTYALLASRCRQRLASPQAWRMFNRMGAACLVAAGLFTASLQREN